MTYGFLLHARWKVVSHKNKVGTWMEKTTGDASLQEFENQKGILKEWMLEVVVNFLKVVKFLKIERLVSEQHSLILERKRLKRKGINAE